MASPHVAGVAARYLQANPGAAPQSVADAVNGQATPTVGSAGSGSPDRLLYADLSGTPTPPPPTSTACGSYPSVFNGSLSGSGSTAYQPSGGSFTTTVSGVHKGCLDGPSTADFDLYLRRRSAFGSWSTVASGRTTSADETVTYSGSAATYRWRVTSYRGSGAYTFGMPAAVAPGLRSPATPGSGPGGARGRPSPRRSGSASSPRPGPA